MDVQSKDYKDYVESINALLRHIDANFLMISERRLVDDPFSDEVVDCVRDDRVAMLSFKGGCLIALTAKL